MHLSKLLKVTAAILAALMIVSSVSLLAAKKSSISLIEDEYAKGNLTLEQKLVLEVQSIKDQPALPPALQSSAIEVNKCGTEILLEVRQNWASLSAENQDLVKNYLARPTRTFSYNSPGGNFKIWYDVSGTHAVPTADVSPANGVPDYIDWIAGYCDNSYAMEVSGLGHLDPPSDGAAGGDSRYDIYTEQMSGIYGYTQPELAGPNPWNDATSYISVHRNFLGFPPNDDPEGDQKGAAKVTVAHEYYHAVQFAYDVSENVWFMEASSTWMEDYVYDQVNDNYNYCSDWFSNPDWSLHSTSSLHLYAAFIWPMYLTQNYGAGIMKDIWNELISTTPYPAFTTALAAQGKTLNAEVGRFDSWNFATGSRSDASHFEEGSHYPLITLTRTHNAYPVSGQGPVSGKSPDAMGANYVLFNIPGDAQSITVDFNGDNSTPWVVTMMAWKSSPADVYSEATMLLNGTGDGIYTLNNANTWNSLVMVITNASQSLNDRSYVYGASYATTPAVAVSVNSVADDSVYSHTTTTVSFQVQNDGVASETFNLTVGDSQGWTLTPSASSITLNSAEAGAVTVQAVCPIGTLAGVFDDVWLKAEATSTFGVDDADTASVEVFIKHGDADNTGLINISDAVYDINYIFSGGPTPVPVLDAGDANCNGSVNISDVVFTIAYIFSGGPAPPCNPF